MYILYIYYSKCILTLMINLITMLHSLNDFVIFFVMVYAWFIMIHISYYVSPLRREAMAVKECVDGAGKSTD